MAWQWKPSSFTLPTRQVAVLVLFVQFSVGASAIQQTNAIIQEKGDMKIQMVTLRFWKWGRMVKPAPQQFDGNVASCA